MVNLPMILTPGMCGSWRDARPIIEMRGTKMGTENQPHTECTTFKHEMKVAVDGLREKFSSLDESVDEQIERAIKTEKDVVRIESSISALKEKIATLVSKDEFSPIRALVYGMVGMALTGVLSAVLAKIISK